MSRYSRLVLAIGTVSLLGSSLVANGDIIFNNFGPGDSYDVSGRLLQGESVGTIGNVDQAVSFTVGAISYDLTSVSVAIGATAPPNIGTGPVDIILATDVGGLPGATLQLSPLNINVPGTQVWTAPFPGTLTLSANTTYWVIVDAKTTFDGGWAFNSIGDIGPTAGRTNNNPWNLRPQDDRYATRVEGRPVPEPVSMALMSLGAIGLLRKRARRGSARA